MALVTLPTIQIDDTQIPRLRAAIDFNLINTFLHTAEEVAAMTNAEAYKTWLIAQGVRTIQDYERYDAHIQAETGLQPPPDLT